tara:strand:- start:111 stop:923 length:813 start_codon:yes stop_codon:yes gene_type:complete
MLKLLPLSTHNKKLIGMLEITTKLPCPNNCNICPQAKLAEAYKGEKVLSFENFKKIIKKIPKNISICFAGFSEPFINKNCVDMIVEADKNHKINIFTTGVGMTLEDVQKIKHIKFSSFMLHLPDDKYFNLKKTETYNKVISSLKSEIPNLRTMRLDDDPDKLVTRSGLLSFKPSVYWTGTVACKMSFYQNKFNRNILLPNCDVVICCMDYGLEYPMGNLLNEEYESLFKSDAHNKVLKASLSNEEDFICRKCEYCVPRANVVPCRSMHLP